MKQVVGSTLAQALQNALNPPQLGDKLNMKGHQMLCTLKQSTSSEALQLIPESRYPDPEDELEDMVVNFCAQDAQLAAQLQVEMSQESRDKAKQSMQSLHDVLNQSTKSKKLKRDLSMAVSRKLLENPSSLVTSIFKDLDHFDPVTLQVSASIDEMVQGDADAGLPNMAASLKVKQPELPKQMNLVKLQQIVQQAVALHGELQLEQAFRLYCIAAFQGYSSGLFLCGLSLRHGWGCNVNQELAFRCLERACQVTSSELKLIRSSSKDRPLLNPRGSSLPAQSGHLSVPKKLLLKQVDQLSDRNKTTAETFKQELAMCLYEVGQCYRFQWGVTRSLSAAAFYYRLSAELDDADAQQELSLLYSYGKGVERNRSLAAAYMRMAVLQGKSEFGVSWIYKPKYNLFFKQNFPRYAEREKQQIGKLVPAASQQEEEEIQNKTFDKFAKIIGYTDK